MNLALKLKIFFFYRYVGQDEFGNKYYEQKNLMFKNQKEWLDIKDYLKPQKYLQISWLASSLF